MIFENFSVSFNPGKATPMEVQPEPGRDFSVYLGPEVNTTVLVRPQNALHWRNYYEPGDNPPSTFKMIFGMSAVIAASYILGTALLPHERRRKSWLEMICKEEYYILNAPLDWDSAMTVNPDSFRQPRAPMEICFDPGNPKRNFPGPSSGDYVSIGGRFSEVVSS